MKIKKILIATNLWNDIIELAIPHKCPYFGNSIHSREKPKIKNERPLGKKSNRWDELYGTRCQLPNREITHSHSHMPTHQCDVHNERKYYKNKSDFRLDGSSLLSLHLFDECQLFGFSFPLTRGQKPNKKTHTHAQIIPKIESGFVVCWCRSSADSKTMNSKIHNIQADIYFPFLLLFFFSFCVLFFKIRWILRDGICV